MHDAQIWRGRFRTFDVIDDVKREALSIEPGLNLLAQRVLRTPGRITAKRGYQAMLRMDDGCQDITANVHMTH